MAGRDDSETGPLGIPILTREDLLGPWRRIVNADDLEEVLYVVRIHGWPPAMVGVGADMLLRIFVDYLFDPAVVGQGYFFNGWPLLFLINAFTSVTLVFLSWLFYIAFIGTLAGVVSSEQNVNPNLFKAGGYAFAAFVPVLVLTIPVAATLAFGDYSLPPEAYESQKAFAKAVFELRGEIARSPQMLIAEALRAIGWAVVGFLMLPVTQRLYELDSKRAVFSVLPPTLIAMYATTLA